MFGSNDDKKTPAPAGEKKGLFGWLRKKPQETVAERPQDLPAAAPETVVETTPVVAEPHIAPIPAEPLPEAVAAHELAPVIEQADAEPWLKLPVAEEPVALTPESEPHVTPEIPAYTASPVQPEVATPQPAAQPAIVDATSFEVPPSIEPSPVALPDPVAGDDLPALSQPSPVAPPPVSGPVVTPVVPDVEAPAAPATAPAPGTAEPKQPGFFARLKQGLSRPAPAWAKAWPVCFWARKPLTTTCSMSWKPVC